MMLKNDMFPLVNRFAMHHFRSGFLIVVTDVWTRSLLTPVSWFHYQFAATLCLFFYCYKWLLRAPSSSGRFQWRATFITFLSTQHKPSRVPQDGARNAAPQSTSSWTAFFSHVLILFLLDAKDKDKPNLYLLLNLDKSLVSSTNTTIYLLSRVDKLLQQMFVKKKPLA